MVGLTYLVGSTSALAAHDRPTSSGCGIDRRCLLRTTFATLATTTTTTTATNAQAASNTVNRSDGYTVQHTDREWSYMLSGAQYNVLRQGGTERQKSSILNTFTSTANVGTYVCAGCNTPLFQSADKFSSNTGWPSFASGLVSVETEDLDPFRATLDGREVRCGTCGGHLGDVFNDGWLFVGTRAAKTGQRFCIDGAALIYKPADTDSGEDVYGDTPPPNKVINYEAAMYRNPR